MHKTKNVYIFKLNKCYYSHILIFLLVSNLEKSSKSVHSRVQSSLHYPAIFQCCLCQKARNRFCKSTSLEAFHAFTQKKRVMNLSFLDYTRQIQCLQSEVLSVINTFQKVFWNKLYIIWNLKDRDFRTLRSIVCSIILGLHSIFLIKPVWSLLRLQILRWQFENINNLEEV